MSERTIPQHNSLDGTTLLRSLTSKTAIALIVTAISVITVSLLAVQTDEGNFFPLLVITVIAWAVAHGTFAGVLSSVVISIYSGAFIYFVLGRSHTLPYVSIAAFIFVAVGYVVGALSDLRRKLSIHERQLAETSARLTAELDEKQVLLAEVHHRLKNNLNTVVQMLMLQAETTQSSETSAALRDASNRMRSMSVLYDKLHQSGSIQRTSARSYLESLVDEVAGSLSDDSRVEIITAIDEFDLGVKTLSTIGIIVNELITNAMKHAFPGGRSGTVTVSARFDGDLVTLVIEDDGTGMAEPPSDSGFGSTLVHALAGQLDAELSEEHTDGARFTLTFVPGED